MKLWEKYMGTTYEQLDVLKETVESKVVLAYDKRGKQACVLKQCAPHSRALYETLKELSNTHIPAIYRLIEQDRNLLVVEEYIEGRTLAEFIHSTPVQCIDEVLAVNILRQLCECLAPLHAKGIIHRDIKPSNLILTKDGVVKLIDFGIARTEKQDIDTDTEFLGTRGYAPPEQYGFGQTDARSDIYALGVTMQRALGKEYTGYLKEILLRCTALDPANRYPSVEMLKNDLESRKKSRTWEKAAVFACSIIAFIGLAWYGFINRTPAKEPPANTASEDTSKIFAQTAENHTTSISSSAQNTPSVEEQASPAPQNEPLVVNPVEINPIQPDNRKQEAASLQTYSLVMTAPQFVYDVRWKDTVQCTLFLNDEPAEGFSLPYSSWETWQQENGEIYFPPAWKLRLRIENHSAKTVSHPRIRMESFTGEEWLDAPPLPAGQSIDIPVPLNQWPLHDMRSFTLAIFLADNPNPSEPQAGVTMGFGLRQ